MRPNYINTLRKKNGNTADIVSVVMEAYNQYWHEVINLVPEFGSGKEATRNIFDFVIENIEYEADPDGVQWVQTPARFVAVGIADCKSMSLFIASCLRALQIDHFFRFVSLDSRKEATHVYVVAVLENGEQVILDPVVRRNGMPVYNIEEKYTYKSDMRGTDIYLLSGINKRSNTTTGIGTSDARFEIYTGERPDNLSPGKLALYARMDLLFEMGNITPEAELAPILNDLDIVHTAISLYDLAENESELQRHFFALAVASYNGLFANESTDLDAHASRLPNLLNEVLSQSDESANVYDTELYTWLSSEVLSKINITGIGAIWDLLSAKKMEAKLKEAAYFYIYIFLSDADAKKLPTRLQKKRNTQIRAFNWQHKIDIWHSKATCMDIIRSGIIARTGKTPEQYLKAEMNHKANAIGFIDPVTAYYIIMAIVGLVQLLVQVFGKKNAPPSNNELKAAIADTVGDGLRPQLTPANGTTTAGVSSESLEKYLPWGLAALAVFKFLK